MRFLIEPIYCMTWIWTLHRAHNKLKSPIEEDNIWATLVYEQVYSCGILTGIRRRCQASADRI